MKLKFLLQKNTWFIEHQHSWYVLDNAEQQQLAASVLPLVVVDEHELIEQPHVAGEAWLSGESGTLGGTLFSRAKETASLRVKLREPDGTLVHDDSILIDATALASIEWITSPFGDGWIDATSSMMLDNVDSLQLQAFLPGVEGSSGKTLKVRNETAGESTDLWLQRDVPSVVPLLKEGKGGTVILHLDCDPEPGSGGDDSRRLGFVLVGQTIKAA